MEIIQCFKDSNWDCIADWSVSNIAWEVFKYVIIFIFLKFLFWDLPKVIIISRRILNRNRITKGNGYGKKRADVFVGLWYSDKDFNDSVYECFSTGATQGQNSTKVGAIVENELQPIGLAEIFKKSNTKKVRDIKNLKNRLIFYVVKFYLIHFIGDNPRYYKNLKIKNNSEVDK